MSKKIILVIVFLAVLTFIPLIKVSAAMTQVYIGVQVVVASAPGCLSGGADYQCGTGYSGIMTDNNWCLPVNSTLIIQNNGGSALGNSTSSTTEGYISPSTNNPTTTTTSPICAGSTMWSGLFNLTSGTTYKAYIYTPNFCPGVLGNAYAFTKCWVTAGANANCASACANYGLTSYTSGGCCQNDNFDYNSTGCGMIQKLKGSACGSCSSVAYTGDNYYTSTGACYYTGQGNYGCSNDCNAAPGAGSVRACACNYDGTQSWFTFTFIP